MKIWALTPSILLVLLNLGFNHGAKKYDSGANCPSNPDPAYCGRPSAIADLFCFLSGSSQPGQSYVYIGFDDYIIAFCSYYYNCQPAQIATLNVLDVYGYFINLTYPMKNGTTGHNLYYIDVTVSGCPQFQKVLDPNFYANSFDTATLHTPVPLGFSYSAFQNLNTETELACNNFPSIKVGGDCCGSANQYTCPAQTPYMFKTPVASLDFSHIKNVGVTQNIPNSNVTVLAGETLVEDNGLYATCVARPFTNETDDNSILRVVEYCTADRYDNFPFCNSLNQDNSLSRIVESYGYDKYTENCLNASTACTISTLYAQGFNKEKRCGKDYRNCNCNSFTTFCSFQFLLPQSASQDLGIAIVFTRGYVEIGFQQDIMRKFLGIC